MISKDIEAHRAALRDLQQAHEEFMATHRALMKVYEDHKRSTKEQNARWRKIYADLSMKEAPPKC